MEYTHIDKIINLHDQKFEVKFNMLLFEEKWIRMTLSSYQI